MSNSDTLYVVKWRDKYAGVTTCVSGEYGYDYTLRRFGFNDGKDYETSFPGKFVVNTNQITAWKHTKRGKPYKRLLKEYDMKGKSYFNPETYGLIEPRKFSLIIVLCIQSIKSNTFVLSLSMEQFKKCRFFDSVSDKDLWFCWDWQETS